jgi:hypothetical protein
VAGDADSGEHEAREEPGACVQIPASALQACDEEAESTRAGDEPEGGRCGPLAPEQCYRYQGGRSQRQYPKGDEPDRDGEPEKRPDPEPGASDEVIASAAQRVHRPE